MTELINSGGPFVEWETLDRCLTFPNWRVISYTLTPFAEILCARLIPYVAAYLLHANQGLINIAQISALSQTSQNSLELREELDDVRRESR